jgi:peptide/nickel transport system substrate-binding protein
MALAAAGALAASVALTSSAALAQGPTTADEVVLATFDTEFKLTALDYNYGYPGFQFVKLQYDTLVQMDESNQPQPLLATEWSSNEDATEWSFTLRDDVTWHDGEAFDADDVVFTVTYQNEVVRQGGAFTTMNGWTAVAADPTTVNITTPVPEPDLIRKLDQIVILAQHVWDGVGAVEDVEESQAQIRALENWTGTGPYKMVESNPDASYTFEANSDYFLGAPSVQRLVVPIIKETTTLFSSLQSGEVDAVVSAVPAENIETFRAQPNIGLQQGPAFSSRVLQINNAHEPFGDPVVRQALGKMINAQELVDVAKLGQATVGSQGFVHPNVPGAAPGLTLTQDVEGANALLEEAGYVDSDGDGVRELPDGSPMAWDVIAWAEEPDMIRAADLLKEYAAAIGITLTTRATETNAAVDLVWPGFDRSTSGPPPMDLAVWNWSSGVQNVPAQAVELMYHSDVVTGRLNVNFYESEQMDTLLGQLKASTDPEERADLLIQVQELAAQDLPMIVLWYPTDTYAYDSTVYDGWRFMDGLGTVHKLSFLPQVYP